MQKTKYTIWERKKLTKCYSGRLMNSKRLKKLSAIESSQGLYSICYIGVECVREK